MPARRLSVVIVGYNMPQQIVRTLRSLSPRMQRGIAAEDYELVVVDNGSPQPIDVAACERWGGDIRWLEVEDPPPSPARAANLGLAEARGELVGVLIDGARMASPGMLAHALIASRVADRPVISTLSYHLGREPQYVAALTGYDEAREQELLARSGWEGDGYRLFDVSVPGGASPYGVLNSPFETNCPFMPSALWSEVGGFEEEFESAGGGLVNLDLFKRACDLPEVQLVSLLGEATFHQAHGGVSTNAADYPLAAWQAEYERLRGTPFRVGRRRMLSIGSPPPQAIASIHREGATGELVRRYVELLKSSLLGETALEAEAAFYFARDALGDGQEIDDRVAYDVRAGAPEYFTELVADRAEGRFFRADPRSLGFGYSMIGRRRMDEIDACVTTVLDDEVPGDLVECGTWRGGAAILMRGILAARAERGRDVWVVDSFAGLPPPTGEHETFDLSAEHFPQLAVAQERVAENFERFGLLDGRVRFLEGWFKDTLPDAPIKRVAVLRLDGDLYESTMTSLTALYDRVSAGGYVIVDDYGALPGCKAAVDEFRAARGIDDLIVRVDWTGIHWRKAVRGRSRAA